MIKKGQYVADVTVKDPDGAQDRDAVVIRTDNSRPVANAGPDQRDVSIGNTVTLDGGNSKDADNDQLTFAWALTVKPLTSTATLLNSATTNPEFVPDVGGTYLGQLVVGDATQRSAPDTIVIATTATRENTPPCGQCGI